MKLQGIRDIDIVGKKVFIRCDFNVPVDEFQNITDDRRIKSALNTVRYCIDNDCAVIIASHFGRPKNGYEEKFSLKPIVKRIHTILKQEIKLASFKNYMDSASKEYYNEVIVPIFKKIDKILKR